METLDTSLEVSRSVYYLTVNKTLLAVVLTLLVVGPEARGQQSLPIIDMHLHAYSEAEWNSQPPNPATGKPAPVTAEEHMRACLELMDRYNIVLAMVSGPLEAVGAWRSASATRVWASPLFGRPGFDYYDRPLPGLESLRTMYRELSDDRTKARHPLPECRSVPAAKRRRDGATPRPGLEAMTRSG